MFEVIEKQFKCVCGAHMIEIAKYADDDDIFLIFWYYWPNDETFWEKLKTFWRLLWHGKEMYANIILTPAMAKKLSTVLEKAAGDDRGA